MSSFSQSFEVGCKALDAQQIEDYIAFSRTAGVEPVGGIEPFVANTVISPSVVGESLITPLNFIGDCGELIPAEIEVTRLTGGGAITVINNVVSTISQLGNGDYNITVRFGTDKFGRQIRCRLQLQTNSRGGTEAIVFNANSPVEFYDRGPGAPALTLPYVGGWSNNNNNNLSAFGFGESDTFTWRSNGANNVSSSTILGLNTGPLACEVDECKLIDLIEPTRFIERAALANFLDSAEPQTSSIFTASIDNQNVNTNGPVLVTVDQADNGWTLNGSEASFNGLATSIVVNAHCYQRIAANANGQRVAPALDLERWDGAAWQVVASSSTGYIRDFSDHEGSSNTIFYRDRNPIANPQYRLLSRQGSSIVTAATVVNGQFDIEAVLS